MPRRPPPLDRVLCEAELPAEELTTLRAQAAALGIPSDKWHRVPSFAALWGTYAIARLAAKLREVHGFSKEAGQAEAAMRLGISDETIRSRRRRFLRDAHDF